MKDFKIVYIEDKVLGDYLICNHCGKRVERGCVSVSTHYLNCNKCHQGLLDQIKDMDFSKYDFITKENIEKLIVGTKGNERE